MYLSCCVCLRVYATSAVEAPSKPRQPMHGLEERYLPSKNSHHRCGSRKQHRNLEIMAPLDSLEQGLSGQGWPRRLP